MSVATAAQVSCAGVVDRVLSAACVCAVLRASTPLGTDAAATALMVLFWLVAVWVADCHGYIWHFLAGKSVFEKSC